MQRRFLVFTRVLLSASVTFCWTANLVVSRMAAWSSAFRSPALLSLEFRSEGAAMR